MGRGNEWYSKIHPFGIGMKYGQREIHDWNTGNPRRNWQGIGRQMICTITHLSPFQCGSVRIIVCRQCLWISYFLLVVPYNTIEVGIKLQCRSAIVYYAETYHLHIFKQVPSKISLYIVAITFINYSFCDRILQFPWWWTCTFDLYDLEWYEHVIKRFGILCMISVFQMINTKANIMIAMPCVFLVFLWRKICNIFSEFLTFKYGKNIVSLSRTV